MTMLRLKARQRAVLSDKLPDAANVFLAGFVVGQGFSNRPFSLLLALLGVVEWVVLMASAIVVAARENER